MENKNIIDLFDVHLEIFFFRATILFLTICEKVNIMAGINRAEVMLPALIITCPNKFMSYLWLPTAALPKYGQCT